MSGYIRERGKNTDGTTSFFLEVSINTKRYYKTVRCKSKAEAKKLLAKFYTKCSEGNFQKGTTLTWGSLCDLWLEEYALVQYKKSTYTGEKSRLEYRVKNAFNKKISKISRMDIQKFINELSKEVSPKTLRNYYALISNIFKWSVQKNFIDRSPCVFIDLPKKNIQEASYLDIENFYKVINSMKNAPLKYRVGLYLALFCGFRRAEIIGLDWDNVDLKKAEYKIIKTRLPKVGGGVYSDTPKTKSSIRQGKMPDIVVEALEFLKIEQEENKKLIQQRGSEEDANAIMVHEDGTIIAPSTLQKWIDGFIKKENLPKFTLHGLRHTHASIMRYLGSELDEISKKLGHSQKSTTENIYVHMFEDFKSLDDQTSEKINKLIQKK